MKKLLLVLMKIVLPAGILAYLAWDAHRNHAFEELVSQPKNWWLLAAATAACSSAVLLTLVRWHYLVRGLDLPFSLKDALRLGFLGYLFNFAPMGIVGGDLLKAVLLARRLPGHRAEAVATIFVDRVVGLYLLFVVATAAMFASGFWRIENIVVHQICLFTLAVTVIGTLALAMLFVRDMERAWSIRLLGAVPCVGQRLENSARRLALAVQLYRRRPDVILISSLMSIGVHSLFSLGVFLIARGLYDLVPSLGMHLVLSPLSAATGVLPISFGPFELVLDRLYAYVPMGALGAIKPGQGFVVALGYRIITGLIAVVGICYYLGSRAEVTEVLQEAEEASGAAKIAAAATTVSG